MSYIAPSELRSYAAGLRKMNLGIEAKRMEDAADVIQDMEDEAGSMDLWVHELHRILKGVYEMLPRPSCPSPAPDDCPVCEAKAMLDRWHRP